MANETKMRISSADLRRWIAAIFVGRGLPEADAALVSEALVDTDMRGIETHGVAQLPVYLAMLDRGVTNPRPDIRVEQQGAMLRVQADRALGQVAARRALDAAMAMARSQGAAIATIAQTGHLGALGFFTRLAAEAGMIALLLQNGPPLMALPGAHRRAIGNNPIAFSAPVAGRQPIVLDIATSEVAYGKLISPAASGDAIPEGWAFDDKGAPTTDAKAALAGMLVPAGGFKGIGLAMMIEVLAGSLTATRPAWGGGIFGGFLLVANPDAALARSVFDADIASWLGHYEASVADGRYPGTQSARHFEDAVGNGVPLSPALHRKLSAIGEKEGRPLPASQS
jgi:LDH2 family malate/lactate/ureidoglycolate dehydrogenase